MELASTGSAKLNELFSLWYEEFVFNMQHDTNDNKAWNALVQYLMDLEKRAHEIVN